MAAVDPIVLTVMLLAVLVGALWLLQRRPRGRSGAEKSADGLDTLAAWHPQATRVLNDPECAARSVLVRAFPRHLVLAQVPLARFLHVPTRHSYREWARRIGSQCADLVICDASSQVLAVVEVRSRRSPSERTQRRHDRLARVLEAANIPLHIWIDGAFPSVEVARRQIDLPLVVVAEAPELQAIEADADGSDFRRGGAMAGPRLGPHPVPLPDQVVEIRDAPSSTWFDDFDSRGAPLDEPPRKP